MIASIHQPNHLPPLGFFHKMKQSDVFVILDTAQYVKNDYHNRNRIRTPQGSTWLTIPIPSKDCYQKRINEVPLPEDKTWAKKHLKSMELSYGKAPYFNEYIEFFREIYGNPPKMLVDLNVKIIKFLKDSLGIKTKLMMASEMNIDPSLRSIDMLIEILKKVGATEYISGKGRAHQGKGTYIDEEDIKKFQDAGIKLRWHEFTHPEYPQPFPGFEKHMAAIDALFMLGPKAKELI